MKKRLKTFLPWFITIIIFYFLFQQVPPGEILAVLHAMNWPLFIVYAVGYFLIILFLDCLGLRWAISRFSTQVNLKETLLMRGATYLLMLINYNLGQGGISFYLKKTHKAPLFKTLGAISYLALADISIMLTCAMIAVGVADISYHGNSLRPMMFNVAVFFYLMLFLWILFWKNVDHPVIQKIKRFRLIHWLLDQQLFYAFRESTFSDYINVFLFRAPMIFTVVSFFFIAIQVFQSSISYFNVILYVPIIMFVGILPITPGGMGTGQALTVEFFKDKLISPLVPSPFSASQILLAASLFWAFSNIVLKAIFGLYCLRKKSKSLFMEE